MPRWIVLVPVKPVLLAKSRLRGAVPAKHHAALVRALALDTLRATLDTPTVADVVVVTDDAELAAAAMESGVRRLPDAASLNAALARAAEEVAEPGTGVAALLADLPALRPAELAAALASSTGPAYVPDAAGIGTTLLAAPAGHRLRPRFGLASAAAHGRVATALAEPATGWPGLRTDVDTAADLRTAARLGLGRHTSRLLADLAPELICHH
jgi:2-phospho-L-lactate guanylyltransferase